MQKIGTCSITTTKGVDKLEFDWGIIHMLTEESVTGGTTFSFGHIVLAKGKGHVRHNHPTGFPKASTIQP
jgi:hypothetical protein